MDDLLSGCRRIDWGRLGNHTTIVAWSTCLQNSCNKNQQICGVNIERYDIKLQLLNDIYNVQWFRCMLSRLWGAIGVFEMFIYRGGVANRILIRWGMNELLKQNVPWLYWNKNCIAAAWRYHCSSSWKANYNNCRRDWSCIFWFIVN